MREDLQVPSELDENFVVENAKDAKVFTEPFSPLELRIQKEQPELVESLTKLKEAIGPEAFAKHISTLQSIRRNATTVMLVTSNELHRTNIEANYLNHISKAFDVEYVRTVCL